jgi:copper chaperone CopZ
VKVTPWLVPALVILFAALGVGGARFLSVPSVVQEFSPAPPGGPAVTVFTIRGMKCVDTAKAAAAQLNGLPGVVRFTAYASRHLAEIAYDPAVVSVEGIRQAIEGPVHDPDTGEYLFGVYTVIQIDDAVVHHSGR